MELKAKLENGVLTINTPKTIDTTNSVEVQESIYKCIDANPGFTSIVLDFEETTYISSVGLRVVLKIKKDYDASSIINARSEVYEIFEMTGFTDIINVRKAYRRISTEGCKVIG
ncbi:MAG: STAS domain-containing protein, partial [Bacilli bacterium]|nr:STAS domain-containing protein [Bacilli bacterium]